MLTQTAKEATELTSTQILVRKASKVATRKIWLPRLIYDSLPYFYLTSGFAAFFATLYISEWFWVLPHYLLFSGACVHFAIAISRMRRRRSALTDGEAANDDEA